MPFYCLKIEFTALRHLHHAAPTSVRFSVIRRAADGMMPPPAGLPAEEFARQQQHLEDAPDDGHGQPADAGENTVGILRHLPRREDHPQDGEDDGPPPDLLGGLLLGLVFGLVLLGVGDEGLLVGLLLGAGGLGLGQGGLGDLGLGGLLLQDGLGGLHCWYDRVK